VYAPLTLARASKTRRGCFAAVCAAARCCPLSRCLRTLCSGQSARRRKRSTPRCDAILRSFTAAPLARGPLRGAPPMVAPYHLTLRASIGLRVTVSQIFVSSELDTRPIPLQPWTLMRWTVRHCQRRPGSTATISDGAIQRCDASRAEPLVRTKHGNCAFGRKHSCCGELAEGVRIIGVYLLISSHSELLKLWDCLNELCTSFQE
jgi:hypothetical protein